MLRAVRLATAAFVLVLAGCDDGSPSSEPTAIPDHLQTALLALYAGDHADDKTTTDATCVVDHFLEHSDPAEVRRVLAPDGRVPDPLPPFSRSLAESWTDGVFACTDFADSIVRAQVELSHGKLAPGPFRKCLDTQLSTVQLRAAYLATLTQEFDDPSLTRLQQSTKACVLQARPGRTGR